jgi:hypothetical protein
LATRLTATQLQAWSDLAAHATPPEQTASLSGAVAPAELLFDSARSAGPGCSASHNRTIAVQPRRPLGGGAPMSACPSQNRVSES